MRIINAKADVQIPMLPNFFLQEGGGSIPIEAVEEDGLREIGKVWTEELVKKARAKQKEKE